MDIGVYVSLFNDEYMIGACVENIKKVFPQVRVFDIGSADAGPQIVKDAGVPLDSYPEHRQERKYIDLKQEIADSHDWIFWIDGDEVYPIDCLQRIKEKIESDEQDMIFGWWKNLKYKDGSVWATFPPNHKGPTAYKTSEFVLHRAWPREKIDRRDGVKRENERPVYEGIYCWHGVLLRRSSAYDKKGRMKKRLDREEQFKNMGLTWENIGSLPFKANGALLEEPLFRWY